VGGHVEVHVDAVRDLLFTAAGTAGCSTLNAGVVEGSVVRAEVAAAAIPQSSHDGYRRGDLIVD
jgi:hypothetical protein